MLAIVSIVLLAVSSTAAAQVPNLICHDGQGNSVECLGVSASTTQIHAWAYDFQITNNGECKWYQFRYYQPNTNVRKVVNGEEVDDEGPYSGDNTDGYFVTNVFEGLAIYTESAPKDDFWPQTPPGPIALVPGTTWTVALYHDGSCKVANPIVQSYKVEIPIRIPIPEFSTIALPIAAVIGLVFFFQHKKRKEE